MSKLLEIKDLYGGYQEGVNVLQGISLTVETGEAMGIIGLNGSGKSTLGKAVMNLLPYRSGKILFEGQDISAFSTHDLARLGIAMMHQGGVVFPTLSVWQNLQLAFGETTRAVETQCMASLQEIIPLFKKSKQELMRSMADKLSGGQRHELALAMTLARQPKLVILDEPSAGLSPKAVEEMYEMLEKIREILGITILVIEQNLSKAVGFCGRCVIIQEGTIKNVFTGHDITAIEHTLFDNQCQQEIHNREFWNRIYADHYEDAPWMNDSWKGEVLRVIEPFVQKNAKTLLDYGCGNGYMGVYFYEKGLNVDLSDISDLLIDKLKIQYSETSMGIYQTDTPDDLRGKKYDVIIAWSLLHHINPKNWSSFLKAFSQILNHNGILAIGGWDEDDPVIKDDGKKARYTGCETWYLNSLVHHVDFKEFRLLLNEQVSLVVPPFSSKRIQHCFIFRKKNNKFRQ